MPCPRFTITGPDDFGALASLLATREEAAGDVVPKVERILADVAARGDDALV